MQIEDILKKIDRLDLFHQVINSVKTKLVDDQVIRLDLGYLDLITLPLDIFDQINTLNVLYLNNNSLNSLPTGIFHSLPLLKWLDLGRNRLNDISETTFVKSSSLRVLGLHNNELRSLRNGIFEKLNSLTILDLSNNLLQSLPKGIFSGLTTLEGIALSGNQLPSPLNQNFTSLKHFQTTHDSVVRPSKIVDSSLPDVFAKNTNDILIKKTLNSRSRRLSEVRTITVYSPESVEGKTMITLLLAFAAAKRGFRTVILEANVETPELKRLFNPPKDHFTWVDFLTKAVTDISRLPTPTSIPNLDVIYSPTPNKDLNNLVEKSKNWWRETLKRSITAEQQLHDLGYDLIFVDNQPGTSVNSVNNMVLADTSVMVLRPTTFGIVETKHFIEEMYRILHEIRPRKDFYIWNQIIKPTNEEETKYFNDILQMFNKQLSNSYLYYGGLINLGLMFHLGMGQTVSIAHHLEYFFPDVEKPINALLRLLLDEA